MFTKINPLDQLNARRLEIAGAHLSYIDYKNQITGGIFERYLICWITENLTCRYYIGSRIILQNNALTTVLSVGFENPTELTIFIISCQEAT